MIPLSDLRHARLIIGWARLLMVLLLSFISAHSQAAGKAGDLYQIDVWSAENGLPSSSVTSIVQTPDGYLWVGTYNGLARFDGVRFVTFDPDNTPALTHARVRKLFVDARGTLWINTYDGSLTTFRDDKFALELDGRSGPETEAEMVLSSSNQIVFLYQRGNLIRKSLDAPVGAGWVTITPPSRITGALCCGDKDGTVWYRGRDAHLWRLGNSETNMSVEAEGLLDQNIRCLTTDRLANLWVGTDNEIAFWNNGRFQPATPTNAPSPFGAEFLYVTQERHVWVVASGRVMEEFNRQWTLEAGDLRDVFTSNLSTVGAREDHQGGMWFYNYGRGLFHIGEDGHVLKLNPEDGFPGERVACLFEDREGNFWAGLDSTGLVRVRERTFQTIAIGDGPFAKAAKSVCEDASGNLWIATLGGGLSRWRDGTLSNVTLPGDNSQGFVFCVCPDSAGRLWASMGEEDLYMRDSEFKRVMPAIHGVKALFGDRAGRIWVGAKNGLFMANAEHPNDFQLQTDVARRDVRAIAEEKNGVVWAGAGDGGIYRVETNKVIAYRPGDTTNAQAVWSLLADEDGTVWAGTFRGGLLRLHDGKFTRFGKHDGLPDDVICQILPDQQGNFWIGSQQGIFRVAKSALNQFAAGEIKKIPCTLYGKFDGLPSLECSGGYQPSAWRGNDATLYFATTKGVAHIQPREISPNLLPPLVAIEEMLIDGKNQDISARTQPSAAVPKKTMPSENVIRVPPGKRQFEFRFTGLSLVSPDRVRFRYRLEGLDDNWMDAGTSRAAQYSFLRPGPYCFCVLAGNSDGVWNTTASMLAFNVLPPFYETWWFRTVTILLAVSLVGGTVRYTATRRWRRELARLEQQRVVERERTRIARDIHDDLGAGLTQITLLSELARRDPAPQVDEHLEQISQAARELTRGMDEIVWAIDPENDTLDSLITYVTKFAQDYLGVAGIRCRLDLPEPLPVLPVRAEVRHNLFLAIKEALNNVVKHAHATQVELRLRVDESSFTVVIQDNGRGIASQPSPANSSRTLSGHGLGNLANRLALSHGECNIKSKEGQGTSVELKINFALNPRE